jgi:hypothetical protein
MSIRLIAKDLYRLIREVARLEEEIQNASPEERPGLMEQLRKRKAEREKLHRILEGSKDTDLPEKCR